MIPFLGTTLGAACVFFMKKNLNQLVQRALTGFAAGVMVAASIWSLIIPAIDQSEHMGKFAFVPAAVGFLLGIAFLLLLDEVIPHLHMNTNQAEGPKTSLPKTTMLLLAVTLHNIPEGMSVGLAFSLAAQYPQNEALFSGAVALAVGIAIQNFPEGTAVALPLVKEGMSQKKAFLIAGMTAAVEPVFGVLAAVFATIVRSSMAGFLAFAAGTMIYVVVEELIPQAHMGEKGKMGTLGFVAGFLVMMILDVALG